MAEPAFIVGLARSGTNWLAHALDSHPEIAVLGETAAMGRLHPGTEGPLPPHRARAYMEGIAARSRALYEAEMPFPAQEAARAGRVQRLTPPVPVAPEECTAAALFGRTLIAAAQAQGKTRVVEKTPHHLIWHRRIARAFPEARFVVCLRDPYAAMLSYKHQGDRRGREGRAAARAYHPIGFALVARASFRAARTLLAEGEGRVLLVRDREIAEAPGEVLARVQHFLGAEVRALTHEPVNSSFPEGARPGLAPADIFWLNLIALPSARWYGVRRRASGAGVRTVAASLAAAIPWALYTAGLKRREQTMGFAAYVRGWVAGG